ncbi:hypothetical protein D9M71_761560 [compost metagenome]
MGSLLPAAVQAVEQGQQQADQVEHQPGVIPHHTLGLVVVHLAIELVIGEVDHQQQRHLAYPSVGRAEGAAQEQEQRRQHVEQGDEELAQRGQRTHHATAQHQQQGGQEVADAMGRTGPHGF